MACSLSGELRTPSPSGVIDTLRGCSRAGWRCPPTTAPLTATPKGLGSTHPAPSCQLSTLRCQHVRKGRTLALVAGRLTLQARDSGPDGPQGASAHRRGTTGSPSVLDALAYRRSAGMDVDPDRHGA